MLHITATHYASEILFSLLCACARGLPPPTGAVRTSQGQQRQQQQQRQRQPCPNCPHFNQLSQRPGSAGRQWQGVGGRGARVCSLQAQGRAPGPVDHRGAAGRGSGHGQGRREGRKVRGSRPRGAGGGRGRRQGARDRQLGAVVWISIGARISCQECMRAPGAISGLIGGRNHRVTVAGWYHITASASHFQQYLPSQLSLMSEVPR